MDNTLKLIQNFAIEKKVDANQTIFCQDDTAHGFYYVKSGQIKIYKMDIQGREVEVDALGPGHFFGEVILFTDKNFPVYAQTEKKSTLLFFPKEAIMQAIHKSPEITDLFLNILANKCLTLNQRLELLSLTTVRERLIHFFLTNCSGEKSCLVYLKIKKKQLAARLGTSSETLSRCLRQLQDEKIIEVKNKQIKILDCITLRNSID